MNVVLAFRILCPWVGGLGGIGQAERSEDDDIADDGESTCQFTRPISSKS